MEDNPFTSLVRGIREEAKKQIPAFVRLGEVITPAPLKVNVAQTIQEGDALLKSSSLAEFQAGERLLLIPIENEQRYIIICKVVEV